MVQSCHYRGVEQWQLVGLITRRSLVRIQPPQLSDTVDLRVYGVFVSPAVFGSRNLALQEDFRMNRRPPGSLRCPRPVWAFCNTKPPKDSVPTPCRATSDDLKTLAGVCRRPRCPRHSNHDRHLAAYFVWLRTDYQPRRITGNTAAPRTRRPSTTSTSACRAFFTWASREFEFAQSDQGCSRAEV